MLGLIALAPLLLVGVNMAEETPDPMLLSVGELEKRLPYPLEDNWLRGVAEEAIVDASNLARLHGLSTWHASMVPPVVKTQVRNACVRYMLLVDGTVQARSGDESEMFTDLRNRTGTVFFTDDERETIRAAAGRTGNFGTVGTYRYSRESVTGDRPKAFLKMPLGRGFPVEPSLSGGGW